ncbi:MAG TPA: type 4a pilus biogenesis protein PilO [Candidatus Omnitrophota bacterium]|nr:type 4a pilus biogenesis protein PilO [Candidatus Omnitrophota bacterium]HPT39450.1 type 4a pilus biogenesis protein PilO [Candidatus Omnitrophota bacterium]
MISYDVIERNKNKIVNVGLIILSLVIAFQFHRSASEQVNTLIQQQNSELEKNKVAEDIAGLEKKTEAYKKAFVKKELTSIMDTISGIAKDASVKIVSIKPLTEESVTNYSNSSFLITLKASSYHALGDFITKIENHPDIYLVSEISINSALQADQEVKDVQVDLGVTMKINTIAYL